MLRMRLCAKGRRIKMSHPGNDFIIDMARDEMEDEPEISRGKVNIVFEDGATGEII